MIKLSALLTRRSDLTREQFVDYWTNVHTPLIGTLPPGEVKVARYVQQQATDHTVPGFEPAPYDGVAELWLESADDAVAWFTSDAYTEVVAADEERFLDRSKTRFLFSEEETVFG